MRSEEEQIDCSEVSDLQTNHEEADTRPLLHANNAKETNDRIIIKRPDTDAFVLSIAMQPHHRKGNILHERDGK